MHETLRKSLYADLGYTELSQLINAAYEIDTDMRTLAVKFGVSVSVVFEATGWKDYYEFIVDEDWWKDCWFCRRDITHGE